MFQSIVMRDRDTGRSRGFGFITMSTVDEASRCIKELNGVVCIDAYLMMSAI